MLEGFREVNEIIPLDRQRYRHGNPVSIVAETLSLLRRLRRARFSLAVDFQGYGETALLAWCSGARRRWGSLYSVGRRWAYTQSVTRDDRMHPVDWNLTLLSRCGLPPANVRNEFVLPPTELEAARRRFAELGLDPAKPTLFIQPFTSSPRKNWPIEKHLAVARQWRQRGLQILFGGGPGDRDALERVRQEGYPVSAGAPLLVTAGLMHCSTLVLGADTGLLHLAVAMHKRVLMLMAAGGPGRSPPFQHADWAVMAAAGQLAGSVETARVLQACEQAMAELSSTSLPKNLANRCSVSKS